MQHQRFARLVSDTNHLLKKLYLECNCFFRASIIIKTTFPYGDNFRMSRQSHICIYVWNLSSGCELLPSFPELFTVMMRLRSMNRMQTYRSIDIFVLLCQLY